ncbi:MAG: prepilin-type N-terminal cleavage/methylation domain-containing protein [Clostridiales bacterium]|jgi:prepilin-type N-terminal cleavage/methylation domain-containing protein|nr:prepilin-type N-terminal cleavage/methylation domain-containing protein [Clostridiales bacterium]
MNTKKAGVTLVELIIVLSVLGICLSAALLTLSNRDKTRIENALEIIRSEMLYARKISINESVYIRITFDKRNNGFVIEKKAGIPYSLIKYVQLEGVKVESVTAPQMIVYFTERGTPSSACTITVSSQSHVGKITVNVGSGRVKITEIRKK